MCHLKALSFLNLPVLGGKKVWIHLFPASGETFNSSFSHLSIWLLYFIMNLVSWYFKVALSLCNGDLI